MELGEKLKQARLEAGLSQRQLCGKEITRNMLSRIENGAAKPSMKTLQFLAAGLGKPVSYFLEEVMTASPNQQVMEQARSCFDGADYDGAVEALNHYRGPDGVYDRERGIIWTLSCLGLAEKALSEGRDRYARQLLEQAGKDVPYCGEAIRRQRLLILGKLGEPVSDGLPSLDEELFLRAGEALERGYPMRAARLLDAIGDPGSPSWNLLRGKAYLESGNIQEAARYLHRAEGTYPKETAPLLERCYRELEDYKRAYEYACKQK